MIKRTVGDRSKKKFEDMKAPTGFVNRTDSQFSFVDGTRTFTIEPAATSFKFYSKGKPFVRSAAETVVITDTGGLWYIYYTSVGVLTASQTPWSFIDGSVFIAILYWDATNNSAIVIGEERHGITMDQSTHEYLHDLYGAKWQSGFTPSVTVDGDGSLDAHAEIQSISLGVYFDEDIEHSESEQTSYEVWYKSGASAAWRKTSASAAAVAITTDRPDYNQFTGGAWQRTEVSNSKFTLTHLFITNDINSPNILIMGENEYTNKIDARDGVLTEIQSITSAAMPLEEFIEIATFIIECKDSYTNTYNARLVSTEDGFGFVDFRESVKTGVGGSINHHGNLTGLTEVADHPGYSLVDGTRAFTGGIEVDSDISNNKLKFYRPESNYIGRLAYAMNHISPTTFFETYMDISFEGLGFTPEFIFGNELVLDEGFVNDIIVRPEVDDSAHLGSASYRWKDIYLTGDITDGTNATSAAEIAAAYEHVSDDGSDHSFIDQSVVSGATPTFTCTNFSTASSSAVGVVELAIASEVDTGTDTTRAITSDALQDSKRNIRWLVFNLVEAATDCEVATNIAGDFVSPIAGTILQSDSTPFYLYATNSTAGTTGTMVVDISINTTSIMTTNKLDFDTTEKTTTTAATPPDLTTTSLSVGDIITIDVDSLHTTAAKGLTVYMAVREA